MYRIRELTMGSQWTEARREEIWSVLGTNSQDKASSVVLKLFVLCSRDTDDTQTRESNAEVNT